MATVIGVDIGQKHEPTAICVVETEERAGLDSSNVHFLVRHLERLPLALPYPKVAKRLSEIMEGIERLSKDTPLIYLDATGLGDPIVDLIRSKVKCYRCVIPVHFNHGDRRSEDGKGSSRVVTLGKAYLVCRLQCLLQADRLHLPNTPEAKILAQELLAYEINIAEDANDRYGSFKVGTQDDYVTALGLAVQEDSRSCGRVTVIQTGDNYRSRRGLADWDRYGSGWVPLKLL